MADVLAVRDEYRAQTWAMLIQECNNSGLTKREFCQQRGISEKSFYYWLRKLRTQMTEASAPQLVRLEPLSSADDILEIQYRGAVVKVPSGVDMDAIAALLRSLQSLLWIFPKSEITTLPAAIQTSVLELTGWRPW